MLNQDQKYPARENGATEIRSQSCVIKSESPLRVCVISPLYHPSLGGLGRQAMLLTERLSNDGINIFVIARRMKGMPPADFSPRVRVHRAWSIKPYLHNYERLKLINLMTTLTFSLSCACLLFMHRKKYDIIHFHGASLPLLLNLPVAKVLGKSVIAKVAAAKLGIEAGALKGRYLGLGSLMARMFHMVDGFVATTAEIEEGLRSDGFQAGRINRITNFVDSDFIREKTTPQKEFNGSEHHPVVAFSGRFISRKGINYLLDAWSVVIQKFPRARLVLMGDGPLLAEMKGMAVELALTASVDFLGHIQEVTDELRKADIFVLPSLQEGMPNALLEAMACGLPPVATRIGGVTDIILDGENGILVEPADAENLAGGMCRLLENQELTRRIAVRARKTISDRFSLESIAPKYIDLYAKMALDAGAA